MTRSKLGLMGGAAAIAAAVFVLLGLFVYADRGDGAADQNQAAAPITEQTKP